MREFRRFFIERETNEEEREGLGELARCLAELPTRTACTQFLFCRNFSYVPVFLLLIFFNSIFRIWCSVSSSVSFFSHA